MKILKHGKRYDNGKPFKSTCDFCGCKIEVTRNEIKYQSDQREGSYYYIRCPECDCLTYFRDRRLDNESCY